ncbi:hypothetical protein KDK_60310 [Dictyobacter kobayashii]|uniref:Uncharacterized protein n=1 Tax=Dictyobacter kobayashii TaxID=2014872 RepID=A0A402AT18_9CHLR|nr:hypothetical protein KDK_60310 [Dictyobacter kobayashii]
MSTELAKPSKLRFYSMCVAMNITKQDLYFKTLVNPNFIDCLFAGVAIPESITQKLLDAFNQIAHTHYLLCDFTYTHIADQDK